LLNLEKADCLRYISAAACVLLFKEETVQPKAPKQPKVDEEPLEALEFMHNISGRVRFGQITELQLYW
jgi:hypothetical protein